MFTLICVQTPAFIGERVCFDMEHFLSSSEITKMHNETLYKNNNERQSVNGAPFQNQEAGSKTNDFSYPVISEICNDSDMAMYFIYTPQCITYLSKGNAILL